MATQEVRQRKQTDAGEGPSEGPLLRPPGGQPSPRAKPSKRPPPTISEIEPADSDEDDKPRRRRAARMARASNHGTQHGKDQQQQGGRKWKRAESSSWGLPVSPEFLMVVASVVVCFAMAKYLDMLPGGVPTKVFTKEELSKYNPSDEDPIYLALLGHVFDVSKTRKLYGAGGGYDFFAGKDATRAFITGDFKEDLHDDLTGFTPEQYKSIVEWKDFYRKDYKYVGKVEGRFFDHDGNPKEDLLKAEDGAKEGRKIEALIRKEKIKHPNCNMKWSQKSGGEVWCDHGRYPRKIVDQVPGTKLKPRCACFKDKSVSDTQELYDQCTEEEKRCPISRDSMIGGQPSDLDTEQYLKRIKIERDLKRYAMEL